MVAAVCARPTRSLGLALWCLCGLCSCNRILGVEKLQRADAAVAGASADAGASNLDGDQPDDARDLSQSGEPGSAMADAGSMEAQPQGGEGGEGGAGRAGSGQARPGAAGAAGRGQAGGSAGAAAAADDGQDGHRADASQDQSDQDAGPT